MSDNLAYERETIGGIRALAAAMLAAALSTALLWSVAALADQSGAKAYRFLHPSAPELPVWQSVEPGKAAIFKRPTPLWEQVRPGKAKIFKAPIPIWEQVAPGKAKIFERPPRERAHPGAMESFAKPTPADPVEEVRCLALNIYFEARSEPEAGKFAVGHVVMNRVRSGRFPETVCDVVRQGGEDKLHRCQFSWWCDGRSDRPRNRREWQKSVQLALQIYWGRTEDLTAGALWYHADYVDPVWNKSFARGPKIGRHIFYTDGVGRTQLASRVPQR